MKKTIWMPVLLLILFITLTVLTVSGAAHGFNDTVYRAVARFISPRSTNVMIAVSYAGEWFVYVPIAVLLIAIPATRIRIGLPAGIVLASSAILNTVLKLIFHIDRPDILRLIIETGYGFPSGHAMNGTAFIGICCWLFIRYSDKKALRCIVLPAAALFLILMGLSRIYLGVHTVTDVLAGYTAGLVLVMTAALVCGKIYPRADSVCETPHVTR